jgi:surfactin synthase thioesterase subunit
MTGRWIDDAGARGDVRLFCFAHAGGGGGFFRPWRKELAPDIAVTPVVLPGREWRWREPAFVRMEQLIGPLCDALRPHLDRPFAFFGHSLGAIVAYEAARRLGPSCLLVSARRAPHLPARRPPIHDLPHEQFLAELERLNGTDQSLLHESALLQALLPGLRADFELNDTYAPAPGPPLSMPVSAFAGDRDELVSVDEMRRWGELTTAEFGLRVFDGDHFYLAGARSELLDAIRTDVARAVRRGERELLRGR